MQRAPVAQAMPSTIRWLLTQLRAAAATVLLLCGGGLLLAVWRRRLSWQGFFAGLCVLVCGAIACAWQQHRAAGAPQLTHGYAAASMAVAALAGAAVVWRSKRIGFWELEACFASFGGAVAWLLGRSTWPFAAQLAAAPAFDPMYQASLGAQYFGPLWDRMLGLWLPLGFFTALWGASWALCLGMAERGSARRSLGILLEWRLACRHLRSRRSAWLSSTALVAIVGVALGVAALVTVTAVMSGYQDDIQQRILSTNAHLVLQKYGADFVEYKQVVQQAQKAPGVAAAAPFAFNEAMLASERQGTGILIKGIDAASAVRVTDIAAQLCTKVHGTGVQAQCINAAQLADAAADHSVGTSATAQNVAQAQLLAARLAPQEGVPAVVLGLSLLRRLQLPIGARVQLLTPVGMAGSRSSAPKRQTFVVTGAFRTGMHEFDSRLVYTSLSAAQGLLGLGQAVSGVELRLDDPFAVEQVGRDVLTRVGRYPYRTLDWRQLNAGIFTALTLQKVVMFLVLAFIVVVASFNIASTLFMAVVEKAQQVAVLKSMGASDASILKVFVFEGLIIGMLGTGLGLVLGFGASFLLSGLHLAIAADVYMVEALRLRIDGMEVLWTALLAIGICHLATLYPSLRAAGRKPMELFREA